MNFEIALINNKVLYNDIGLVYVKPIVVIDVYYGVSTLPYITEDYIVDNFSTIVSGSVGYDTGRTYTFSGGYNYKYWCIPDRYTTGDRLIERVMNDGARVTFAYDSFYQNYQTNPTPAISVTYGKIFILGNTYRIYRTIMKSSLNYEQVVYSF